MSKLISTFKIGFDDETKVEIAALKEKLDTVAERLKPGSMKPAGGLLAAMSEAANDGAEPDLGQWIFEGCDSKWVSAAKDADNEVWLYQVPVKDLARNTADNYLIWYAQDGSAARYLCDFTSSHDWQESAIDRQPVNDVDYLSESVPEIQGMEASDIIIDEMGRDYSHNSNCLHAVVPQITQADRQLIFIKNLSDVLIQRMHSMDRFSEDDYHIGGDKLVAWDCLIEAQTGRFAIVSGIGFENRTAIINTFNQDFNDKFFAAAYTLDLSFLKKTSMRTITEDELPAFRTALEACYV